MRAVSEHAGEEAETGIGVGAGSVGADEGVPSVEVRVGNLVEHPESVADIRGGREGEGGDETAGGVGVGEEAEAKHAGMDLPELCGIEALVVVKKREHRMVSRVAAVLVVVVVVGGSEVATRNNGERRREYASRHE